MYNIDIYIYIKSEISRLGFIEVKANHIITKRK